jgi:hypothetical protein
VRTCAASPLPTDARAGGVTMHIPAGVGFGSFSTFRSAVWHVRFASHRVRATIARHHELPVTAAALLTAAQHHFTI